MQCTLCTERPRIIEGPKDVTVQEATDVLFRCKSNADPDVTVIWKKQDGQIPPGRLVSHRLLMCISSCLLAWLQPGTASFPPPTVGGWTPTVGGIATATAECCSLNWHITRTWCAVVKIGHISRKTHTVHWMLIWRFSYVENYLHFNFAEFPVAYQITAATISDGQFQIIKFWCSRNMYVLQYIQRQQLTRSHAFRNCIRNRWMQYLHCRESCILCSSVSPNVFLYRFNLCLVTGETEVFVKLVISERFRDKVATNKCCTNTLYFTVCFVVWQCELWQLLYSIFNIVLLLKTKPIPVNGTMRIGMNIQMSLWLFTVAFKYS